MPDPVVVRCLLTSISNDHLSEWSFYLTEMQVQRKVANLVLNITVN